MKHRSAEAGRQAASGAWKLQHRLPNVSVKAKDVNLHYASVSLKAVQENVKPSLRVGLFPKAGAQTGSNLSASVFRCFMDQICFQRLPHREITPRLHSVLLPPSAGPTGQLKITPHTKGEVIVFPLFSWISCVPQPVWGREI